MRRQARAYASRRRRVRTTAASPKTRKASTRNTWAAARRSPAYAHTPNPTSIAAPARSSDGGRGSTRVQRSAAVSAASPSPSATAANAMFAARTSTTSTPLLGKSPHELYDPLLDRDLVPARQRERLEEFGRFVAALFHHPCGGQVSIDLTGAAHGNRPHSGKQALEMDAVL